MPNRSKRGGPTPVWVCAAIMLLVGVPQASAQVPSENDRAKEADRASIIAFTNVTVVAMQQEAPLHGQTVLIEGERIVSIGAVSEIEFPPDAFLIDGTGRYLIPGLCDMHVHAHAPTDDGLLYLNAGVTTVLSLGTRGPTWDVILRERELSKSPSYVGPEIYTVGPQISGGESPDTAERLVRENAAGGFDLFKVHGNLSPESFDRLNATAKEVGIRVTGHAQRHRGMQPDFTHQQDLVHVEEYLYAGFNPLTRGLDRALKWGGLALLVLSLATARFAVGAVWRRLRKSGSPDLQTEVQSFRTLMCCFTGFAWLLLVALFLGVTDPLSGLLAGKTWMIVVIGAAMLIVICLAASLTQSSWNSLQQSSAQSLWNRAIVVCTCAAIWIVVVSAAFLTTRSWRATPGAMERMAQQTAKAGIWVTPNLVMLDYVKRQRSDEFDALNERPEMRYLTPKVRDRWANHNMYRQFPDFMMPMQHAIWVSYTRMMSQMTRALHEANVPLLAGSDAGSPHGVIPGSSLHEELALLVEAGLSPYEALHAATVNPAAYLESSQEFGVVAPGYRADLVLLAGNPLEDIGNTRERVGVMKRGRWYTGEELENMMEALAVEMK